MESFRPQLCRRWLVGPRPLVARLSSPRGSGGVGGNRMLLVTPEPASRVTWLEASSNLRNVNSASIAEADRLNGPAESLARRAKQKSAGGKMVLYSPNRSRQCRVKPMWSPRSVRSHEVGPLVDGSILHEE